MEQIYNRQPTLEELAEVVDMPVDKIAEILKISIRHLSMDAPVNNEEDTLFIDTYVSEDGPRTDSLLLSESLNKEVVRSLEILDEKEKQLLCMFYGIGMPHDYTLDEIGEHFGISRDNARLIKDKAIKKLKKNGSKRLKNYL